MCQKIVGGISVVLGIFGLITLAMGGMSSGGAPDALTKYMPKDNKLAEGGNAGPAMALGVLILIVSLLGCATAKKKHPCFAIPFGMLTFLFGVILLIVGALAMIIASPKIKEMFKAAGCPANNDQAPMIQFDKQYTDMIVKPMCSDLCPCDENMFATWEKSGVNVISHGRTFKPTPTQRSNQNSKGIQAEVVALVAAKGGSPSYTTFLECYNKVLKDQTPVESGTKANGGKKMQEWFKTNGVEGLQKMEDSLKCQGMCSPRLFYVTKPFTDQPENTCFDAIANKISGGARTVGIVSIVTALIAFCACCGSFPLCTKFNDEEGEGAKDAER